MNKSPVLVTGGAGYIGSHVVLALLDDGWPVVVLDNLSTGHRESVPSEALFVEGSIDNQELIKKIILDNGCIAIMHLAGSVKVEESVRLPGDYYANNVAGTLNLLEACREAGVKNFIFSSTAAVYGDAETTMVDETALTNPTSPYGHSKLMSEQMLLDINNTGGPNYVALRYFNVAAGDPDGRSGLLDPNATHLIKVCCEAATGKRSSMTIFGTDYDTPDGTCIRDYIHVSDIASAHLAALTYLLDGGENQILNCGYGHGSSVREVIAAVEKASGAPLNVIEGERRAGDCVELTAVADKIRKVLGWQPAFDDLDKIVGSALAWERKLKK